MLEKKGLVKLSEMSDADYLQFVECWNFKTCGNYVLDNQPEHFFCDDCERINNMSEENL